MQLLVIEISFAPFALKSGDKINNPIMKEI